MNDLPSRCLNWFVTGDFAAPDRTPPAAALREAGLDRYTRTNVAAGRRPAARPAPAARRVAPAMA